jgi:hypothetical protein
MFITAKLVFEHYIPEQLTKGMWFKQKIKDVIYGKIYEYDRIYELNHIPQDMDTWVQANGYPVKPRIMTIEANPDRYSTTLAKAEEIGWWDEGPHVEELRDIELKDFNIILSDFDGEIQIDVEESVITSADGTEEEEIVIPIIYANKCTLRMPMEEEDYDEEYDDYEDMDWEDDEPEEDSAGYTISDRYNPDDYETE